MLNAWAAMDKRRRRIEAQWVANLMNSTGNYKEPITVDSLLGENTPKQLDMEKIRLRAEERKRERLVERERKRGG